MSSEAGAVLVRCPGRGGWRLVQGLTAAAAAGVVGAWILAFSEVGPASLGAVLAALPVGWAVWRRAGAPDGELSWRDGRWAWHEAGSPAPVEVAADLMLDLGVALLLRLRGAVPGGRARWVAVSSASAGASFRPLCTAAHAGRRR